MKFLNKLFKKNSDEKQLLLKCTYENTPEFKFCGESFWAKCVKVYDGDTIHCAFFIDGKPYRIRVRFSNIDTAELKSKNPDPVICDLEKVVASKTRDRLIELIGDGIVYLCCDLKQDEKYQRILAHVYKSKDSTESFNDILVKEGLAYFYDGGTKKTFQQWYLKNK